MLSFRTHGGATLAFDAEFSEQGYANISFFDHSLEDVVFHLSLRGENGQVVSNSRVDQVWGAEQFHEASLEPRNRVELRFSENDISFRLNGQEIALDPALYPGRERIALLELTGGIPETSIEIGGGGNSAREGQGELLLTDPIAIEGWAFDPGLPGQEIELRIEGQGQAPQIEIIPAPNTARRVGARIERIGVAGLLPGWVWRKLPEGSPARLQLYSNGIPCGAPLTITRADMAHRIEHLVSHCAEDLFTMLLALEHVRYGHFLPQLGKASRTTLTRIAEEQGLLDFVFTHDEGRTAVPAPETPAQRMSPDDLLLQKAKADYIAALRADPGIDPVAALPKTPMSPEGRKQLFLALAEHFCLQDDFRSLYTAAAAEDLARFEPGAKAWHNSSILPFLYMQGRAEEIRRLLWRMADETRGWIVTPTVGWTIEQLLRETKTSISDKAREDIVTAFIGFLDKRAENYWERSPCLCLIRACVALLANTPRLPEAMQPDLLRCALRNYGLSPSFWHALDTETETGKISLRADLAATLAQARAAFEVIADLLETGGGDIVRTDRALGLLERLQVAQIDRLRCELLGPAGVYPAAEERISEALIREGRDLGEAALRRLAMPGLDAPEDATLIDAAREYIPAKYDTLPKAPHHALQSRTSHRAASLLARLTADLSAEEAVIKDLEGLTRDLATLAAERSGFIGIGLGLGLMNGLIRLGAERAAMTLIGHLGAIRSAVVSTESEGLGRSPALRAGLLALRRTERQTGNPLAGTALELFPAAARALPPADAAEISDPVWDGSSPLFDTIVTVFSCQPNLQDRVPALREGWLGRLADLGVPYVVITGGGRGQRDGDVVCLNAPDDYEGLPKKTLATVQWVKENTPFSHMLKIDDDCFLDAEAFFHSQSYRKFDYYGRRLTRVPGQLDRVWHCAKSRSARGRYELDKSPERSCYADGGSGYTLSRAAMTALLEQAETPEGRQLVQSSFMEDKLVGDLLAARGIEVVEEDHLTTVRRRLSPGGVPVSRWVNGFDASQAAPVKLVHLDTHEEQAAAQARLSSPALTPKKMWPSYAPVKLVSDTNALELVSSEAQLAKVNAAELAVVSCLRNEIGMLPHFLAHYRKLGVEAFLIADNLSDDGTMDYLLQQPDVAVFSVDTDYRKSEYGVAWQQTILSQLRPGRWSLVADADEFLVWETQPRQSITQLLADPAIATSDAVRIFMLDMYPKGPLAEATFTSGDPFAEVDHVDAKAFLETTAARGPYSNASTWTSGLRHRLMPGSRPELFVAQKIALLKYKPWMRLSAGLHYAAEVRLSSRELLFAHFKYHADFDAKARREVQRGQHFNNAEEYRKYLDLAEVGGQVLYDPAHSVHWLENDTVRRILA